MGVGARSVDTALTRTESKNCKRLIINHLQFYIVSRTGLEPARLAALAPETSASTIPPPGLCVCKDSISFRFSQIILPSLWKNRNKNHTKITAKTTLLDPFAISAKNHAKKSQPPKPSMPQHYITASIQSYKKRSPPSTPYTPPESHKQSNRRMTWQKARSSPKLIFKKSVYRAARIASTISLYSASVR